MSFYDTPWMRAGRLNVDILMMPEIKSEMQFNSPEGTYKLVPPLFSCPIYDPRIPESKRPPPLQEMPPMRVASVFFDNAEQVTKTLFPKEARECLLAFNYGHEVYIHRYRGPFSLLDYDLFKLRDCYPDALPTALCFLTKSGENTNCLAVGFDGGQIRLPIERKMFNQERLIDGTAVTCIEGYPGYPHRWVASYASGNMYVFDEGCEVSIPKPNYKVLKQEKMFTVYYNKTKLPINPLYRWKIGDGSLNHFAFSNDDRYMATVGHDGYMRVFDFEEMELIGYFRSFSGLLHCAWSPDSKLIAAAGYDCLITVYDVTRRDVLLRCVGHTNVVSRVVFDPWVVTPEDQELPPENMLYYRVCSVGHDRKMAFWNIDGTNVTPLVYEPDDEDVADDEEVADEEFYIHEEHSWSWTLPSSTNRFDWHAHATNLFSRLRNFGRSIVAKFKTPPPPLVDPYDFVGSQACPFMEHVHCLNPVVITVVSDRKLTDVIVREDAYVTADVDGFICTWGRPNADKMPDGFKARNLKNSETCY